MAEINVGEALLTPLAEAKEQYLASDVAAPHDHPFFNQSAMDGYAIRFEDLDSHERLRVIGDLPAGATAFPELGPGNAVRIFTGAAVPPTADTVVIQEDVTRDGQWMQITKKPLKRGQNIRKRGEQIGKGQVAIETGTLIDPAAVGYLATLGVQNVEVFQPVSAGILTTGNEFADPAHVPQPGEIFESNGAMLKALLQRENTESQHEACGDDREAMTSVISSLAEKHRVLFVTGGVSVGDYDFTPEALEAAGFRTVFHKVNQKPGKPLLFAVREDCIAFGMPGNPRSVLSCFYQYALPAIRGLRGAGSPALPTCKMPITEAVNNPSSKTLFLFAKFTPDGIETNRIEGSHMLASSVNAPAMIEVPADSRSIEKGQMVKVHLLPQ